MVGRPARPRRRDVIERGKVMIREGHPCVTDLQHRCEHAGQRRLLLRHLPEPCARSAVPGLPPDELRRSLFGERREPGLLAHARPQLRDLVGHHDFRGFCRILGAEVINVAHLARKINQRLDRCGGGGHVLGLQGVPRVRDQPSEGEPPPRSSLVTPAGRRPGRRRSAPTRRSRAHQRAPRVDKRGRPSSHDDVESDLGRALPRCVLASWQSRASRGSRAPCGGVPRRVERRWRRTVRGSSGSWWTGP